MGLDLDTRKTLAATLQQQWDCSPFAPALIQPGVFVLFSV
jgi:hypothetical protein